MVYTSVSLAAGFIVRQGTEALPAGFAIRQGTEALPAGFTVPLGENWLGAWAYRKSHVVDASSVGELTDHWMKIEAGYDTISSFFAPERYASNPFTLPGDGAGYGNVHPCVIYFPDGENGYKFWMFYEHGVSIPDSSKTQVYLVRSNDGLTWVETGVTNPVFSDDTHGMHDPHIIKRGAT